MSLCLKPLSDEEQRASVVTVARSFIGTPYHHLGRIKGAGVDCGTFPAEVYEQAGVIEHLEVPYYPLNWHLHREDERYLDLLRTVAHEKDGAPEPGDLVVFKIGRAFAHGVIVVDWPLVIHADMQRGVVLADASQYLHSERKLFTFWKSD